MLAGIIKTNACPCQLEIVGNGEGRVHSGVHLIPDGSLPLSPLRTSRCPALMSDTTVYVARS